MKTEHQPSFARGFSTIGCPQACLNETIALAREFNLDFIELRALGGTIDLPAYFADNPPAEDLISQGRPVRLIASGLELAEANEARLAKFRDYLDIAATLRASYVRVFGGCPWGETLSPAQWRHAAETVERCRAAIREKGMSCEILLETHSAFSSSEVCLQLNEQLDEPLCILWDVHHTWRSAGESPTETWQKIGPLVRHLHTSDSRRKPAPADGYDCVIPGSGEYPYEMLRGLLHEVRYRYGISLEWEKLWHPELVDIRYALKAFQEVLLDSLLTTEGNPAT